MLIYQNSAKKKKIFSTKWKNITQKLCQLNLKWDEDIPDEISNKRLTWKENLPNLEMVCLRRCFKPLGFGKVDAAYIISQMPTKMVMAKQITFAL